MASLSLQHIDKIYDNNVQAVYDFNMDINDGEFIVRIERIDVGDADEMVRSRGDDHREAAVDGHDVDAAAVMVYVPSHQVDTAR